MNLIKRNTGTAMENQRLAVNSLVDFVQSFEVQTSPVSRILAMDIADTSSEEINAQISNSLALCRISQFTGRSNTIFCTADAADFALNGNALAVR